MFRTIAVSMFLIIDSWLGASDSTFAASATDAEAEPASVPAPVPAVEPDFTALRALVAQAATASSPVPGDALAFLPAIVYAGDKDAYVGDLLAHIAVTRSPAGRAFLDDLLADRVSWYHVMLGGGCIATSSDANGRSALALWLDFDGKDRRDDQILALVDPVRAQWAWQSGLAFIQKADRPSLWDRLIATMATRRIALTTEPESMVFPATVAQYLVGIPRDAGARLMPWLTGADDGLRAIAVGYFMQTDRARIAAAAAMDLWKRLPVTRSSLLYDGFANDPDGRDLVRATISRILDGPTTYDGEMQILYTLGYVISRKTEDADLPLLRRIAARDIVVSRGQGRYDGQCPRVEVESRDMARQILEHCTIPGASAAATAAIAAPAHAGSSP
jgi:hypothetical protein